MRKVCEVTKSAVLKTSFANLYLLLHHIPYQRLFSDLLFKNSLKIHHVQTKLYSVRKGFCCGLIILPTRKKPNVLQFNKQILILTEQIIMYRITHTESDVELFTMATVATIEVRQDYSASTIFTFMYCAYVLI